MAGTDVVEATGGRGPSLTVRTCRRSSISGYGQSPGRRSSRRPGPAPRWIPTRRVWSGWSSTTCRDRAGNSTGELIVLLSSVVDPAGARADELAVAYHARWEERRRSPGSTRLGRLVKGSARPQPTGLTLLLIAGRALVGVRAARSSRAALIRFRAQIRSCRGVGGYAMAGMLPSSK